MGRDAGEPTPAERRLDALLRAGQVAWWETDLETGRTESHPNRARMLGYDPEGFERRSDWLDLVHPDDRGHTEEELERYLDGERRQYAVEHRMRTADGDHRWLHEVAAVVERDGEPRRLAGLAVDVTDHRDRERRLGLLSERGQALMYTETTVETAQVAAETADDVIDAPLSSVHLETDAGDALEPAAFAGSRTEQFGDPSRYPRDADRGTWAALVWETYEARESRYVDDIGALERLSGAVDAGSAIIHPIEGHGVLVVAAPEPHAFTGADRTLADILAATLASALDRVEREQRFRRRENRLERLNEATRALVRAETTDEVADRVVDAAADILGFPLAVVRLFDEDAGGLVPVAQSDPVADLLGEPPVFTPDGGSRNWAAYEHGEPRIDRDVTAVAETGDGGTPIRSLFVLPLGDHGTFSAGDTSPDAFDETDLFLAAILVTTAEAALDATEREETLRRQRDALERQNERLDRFASIVSHDLRNPLSVVSGSIDLAAETGDPADLERAAGAVDRMSELIDDLLTLARAGEGVSETEPVHLASVARRCEETVGADALTVVVDADATVRADASRLAQAIENLMRNSLEHGTGPSGTVTVTVGALPDGFYVADDGPGIDPEDRDRVFESGFTTNEDGTGFGLDIVRDIAQAHGWTVDLTESEAGGARFEFTGVERVD